MSTEAEVEAQGTEPTAEESAAAFAAGEAAALAEMGVADAGDDSSADEILVVEEPEEVTEELTPDEDAGDKPSAEIVMAGLTEDQIKEALAKANQYDSLKSELGAETQKIYGKFGDLTRELKRLSEAKTSQSNEPVKLAKLREKYEDLAELLEADLKGHTASAPQEFDPAPLEEKIQKARADALAEVRAEIAAASKGTEIKILTMKHPAWREKTKTPEYELWKGTLPQEERDAMVKSNDGLYVASQLDKFDKWQKKSTKTKTERLSRAVTPGGEPAPAKRQKTDDALFKEGMRNVEKLLRGE
jgi:hypothetical protein